MNLGKERRVERCGQPVIRRTEKPEVNERPIPAPEIFRIKVPEKVGVEKNG